MAYDNPKAKEHAMIAVFGLFGHSQVAAVNEVLGDCPISAYDLTYWVVKKAGPYSPREPILFLVPHKDIEAAYLRFVRAMHGAIANTVDIESLGREQARKVAEEFMEQFNKSGHELEPVEETVVGEGWIALQERISQLQWEDLANEFLTVVKYFVRCTIVRNGWRVVVGWYFGWPES